MYLCHKTLEICLMWLADNPVCITTKGPASDRTYQSLGKKHSNKSRKLAKLVFDCVVRSVKTHPFLRKRVDQERNQFW